MNNFVVQVENICCSFYDKENNQIIEALSNISLTASRGRITALVGPDGAGKTTFLRLLTGLLTPNSGQITVLGIDVLHHPQEVQNCIGYMPQKFGLYEDLSVLENLNLYADLHSISFQEREKRFERLLKLTDLYPFRERLAGKLSGGMKQKLGLICTLISSPKLLLLDEPSVGVDPISRCELWKIISRLVREEDISVLISTGYIDEAERCESVYLFHQGRILVQGSPNELCAHAQGRCFEFMPPLGMSHRIAQIELLKNEFVIDAVPYAGRVRFILEKNTNVNSLPFDHNNIFSVPARLEDSFILLLKQQTNNMKIHCSSIPVQDIKNNTVMIKIKDLTRAFGDFIAVNRTNFEVKKGEIFGLLGPNGAGKTTTFRMLCGLLPASSGEIIVAGKNMRIEPNKARNHIGYVSQKFSLYGNLTVEENLRFFGQSYGLWGKALNLRIEAVLKQFELIGMECYKASSLAGGLKQRLSMAVSLLHKPEILFLDEPTSGADPLARRIFWRQINELSQQGTTVIVTTHFMEEAEYCDRIIIQDAGEILAIGSPNEVRNQVVLRKQSKPHIVEENLDMEQVFIQIVELARQYRA